MQHLGEFWKITRVESECGVKKTFIYKQARLGRFPRPIKVGAKAVVWSSAQVQAWKRAMTEGREWSEGDAA
ncbi:AlpA family transcriptional regulator [Methylococcus sp. Mc7]|uniref:helix-turn-helix transcriptional regulator n=1 Tax=Methylococcus sp. Mc7 TaxID=2860258 RepID=UPI001C52A8DD|nr:AlpA family phage regulatory protein [Methylococcus sp. Mc7]